MAASGEALFCIGISETEAGSAVGHMRARLTEDGDGFRLNAYKNYVTGGHKSRACLVWCRFPGSEGTKGIGAVVVDLERDGVTVAGTHVKMGLRGTSEAELAFDDVRIDPEDVLLWGDPANNDAFKTLIAHINHERCGNASMCVGAAQGALEYAVSYMNERKIGDKPLASLQGLQWKVADMATQLEGARLLLQRAVRMAGPHGTPPPLETAMAKTAANLAAKFVCDEAIQCLGGYGFSREYPVERVYRDIRGLCIGAGTVEVQRNLIGSTVLRGDVPASNGWRGYRG
jgi:alkylation response protein AidB-like acyl-CoA dehydrogenase